MAVFASQVVFAIDFFDVMWFGCKTDLVEILGKKHVLHMLGASGMRHVACPGFFMYGNCSFLDRLAN